MAVDGETIKAKIGNLHKRVATAQLGRHVHTRATNYDSSAATNRFKVKRGSSW